jgi:hypothetical protein
MKEFTLSNNFGGSFLNGSGPLSSVEAPLADVLDEVTRFVRRFVHFQDDTHAPTVALWAAHTWAIHVFEQTPYLAITSPEKGSGKTRLQEVLELLCREPWFVTLPSDAVLFRMLENKPTLLLDEIDAVFSNDRSTEGLRAVLNVGNRRGASVPRALDYGKDLHKFPVFSPKCFAGIGKIPETLADRSITIPLTRRLPSEKVERLIRRDVGPEAEALRDSLSQAVQAALDVIGAYRAQDVPDVLSDRQQEGWETLFAIAHAAGGHWPQTARDAARTIHGTKDDDDLSTALLLLSHIRETFDAVGEDRLPTYQLIFRLRQRDDGPWARWWDEKFDDSGLKAASGLAFALKPYRITSKQIRVDKSKTGRGYLRADFEPVWQRYLTSTSETETESVRA